MKNKFVLLLAPVLALTLSSCSSGLSAEEVKDGIRKFHYDQRIACEQGSDICFEHRLANAYPLLKFSEADLFELKNNKFWDSSSAPNLETIETDESWQYPVVKCETQRGWTKGVDVSKSLPGQTYVVERADSGASFHMTYLDGKWYDYPEFC